MSQQLLSQWIASNPNRHKGLDMLHKSNSSSASHYSWLPGNPADWLEYDVVPAGPITALYILKDTFFAEAAGALRNQMQLEKRLEMAEKIDNDMRSGKLMRMRRKMHEWLASDPGRLTSETLADVWDILCTVYNIQTICVEEQLGQPLKISFSPENPVNWRSDVPIFVVERNLTKVWNYAGTPSTILKSLPTWLSNMEEAGSIITYPSLDISKVAMVEFLEVLPSWKESMRKHKKDELAPIVGRAKVIELFNDWSQMSSTAGINTSSSILSSGRDCTIEMFITK